MPRIHWVEDNEASGSLADLYAAARSASSTGEVPEIYRTMSLRPDFMAPIMEAARIHFSDGALTRAQHEMIASYVAALNRCQYCLSGHARFLELQGEQFGPVAEALRDGDLARAPMSESERLLLEFVGTLTRHAYRITDAQVERLREAGWSDSQIAEAAYVGALFNLFVRLADAFDIHPPEDQNLEGKAPETVLWGTES